MTKPLYSKTLSVYLPLTLAVCMTVSNAQAKDWALYSNVSSFTFGGPQPIHQLLDGLKGPIAPSDDDTTISHFDLELGAGFRGWQLGYFVRNDYYARFDPDTISLAYLDKNDLAVEANRQYDIWLDIHRLYASGLRVTSPRFNVGSVKLAVGISLFRATAHLDGSITGQITTTEDGFSTLTYVDYSYDEDVLLDRPLTTEPEGWGFGFDVYLRWQVNAAITIEAELNDLAGRVFWDEIPYTQAQITSSTVNFDENGFIETTPVLSGIESYKSHKQTLPLRSNVIVDYRFHTTYGLFVGNEQYGHEHFPAMGVAFTPRDATYRLGWQGNSNSLQLERKNASGRFKLIIDDIDLERAKTFGFEFELTAGW